MKAKVLAEPILFGREKETEDLQRHLSLSLEGKGNTVLVSGEAGSGKTRLSSEFLNAAKKKGITVMAGWCLSDAATPYFPFVEAFNSYFKRFEEETPTDLQTPGEPLGFTGTMQAATMDRGITAWLAGPKPVEKPGKPQAVSPEVWKDQVFAGVAATLHSIAAQEPIILFLEDIHWADSASLALLHYIARSIHDSARILVLGTYRSEELTADAEGRSHPLVETLRLMKREDLLKEIKLPNLGQDSVNSIAQSMLGGNLDPELVDKLTDNSKGNALFVVESLRMWSEQGNLVRERDSLRLHKDELGVPSKFKDIILRRLSALKFGQRRILDVASVVGEKFEPELIGFVLGKGSLEVLETLDEVAQSTRLVCPKEDFYMFDHARTREILYREISSPLRKGYHAKIAEGLESNGKTIEKLPLSSLAYHYAQAGNKEKAIEYALEAGEDALARFGNSEAIDEFKYVLKETEKMSGRSDQRTRALFGLGSALEYIGSWEEAKRIFEILANFAESGAVKLRALSRAMGTSHVSSSIVHTLELAKVAEQYSQFDRLEFARVRMSKAKAVSFRGEIEEALKETREALKVFEEEGSLSDTAHALSLLATYYARIERTPLENALPFALRSATLIKEVGNLRLFARINVAIALMLMSCGLFDKALEYYTIGIEIDEKVGSHGGVALLCFWLSVLSETKGILKSQSNSQRDCGEDYNTAVNHSLKGIQTAEKSDDALAKMLNYGNLVRQYVKLKEMEKAGDFFRKLEETYNAGADMESVWGPWGLAHYFRSKAAFLAAKGQGEEANGFFEKSLISFKNMKEVAFPMFKAETRIAYAEALSGQQMIEEAKEQLEEANVIIAELLKCREKVDRVNISASLMTKRETGVNEDFKMRIDLVNAANNPAVIIKLENVIPCDFKVINSPSYSKIHQDSIEMNARKVDSFQVEAVTLTMQAQKAGDFSLNPRVIYNDHTGETRALELAPITITVRPTIHAKIGEETISVPLLPDRLTTGFRELDVLLYGGIPAGCSVVLNAPRSDERQLLTKRFLEAGVRSGEHTFYISADPGNMKGLAEKPQPNLYLFLCNPQADTMVQDSPNIFKLKGIDNLTDIDIALTKAFRTLKPSATGPKKICIDIVSDVLLQHHAVAARRWLNALLPTLKSKGFTILAIIDPEMHPAEETKAVLGLFDGEISIREKEKPRGTARFLNIRRMTDQKYLKDEIPLTEE